MNIWVQSLSWTLICGLFQGLVVYASLWLVLRLMRSASASARYQLSLSALTVMLAWFATTWWQQHHALLQLRELSLFHATNGSTFIAQTPAVSVIRNFTNYHTLLSWTTVVFPWLTSCYVVGLLFMLARLSTGMTELFSLRRSGVSNPDATIDHLMTSAKRRLHFGGYAQLLISARVQVPMVVGFLKPIILMPAAVVAQLSMEQLETILLHELAHIKRHDYLVNILQSVVETILFFNPFVWIISAIARREREHCCDDLVLAHTTEPICYATALASLAHHPPPDTLFAVAASGTSNYLFNRIKRIMEMKKNQFSYSRMVAVILIIAAIVGSIAWIRPTFSPARKDKSREATPTATHVPAVDSTSNLPDDLKLIQHLLNDGRIDQVKGFLVEKSQNRLFIDRIQVPENIASRYISSIKQEYIRIEVHPFIERLRMHPDAGFMQNLLPVMFSSPCIDTKPRKPGC